MPTTGERLQDERAKKGLTVKQVSEKTGVSGSLITDLENDKDRSVGYKHIVALAQFYGTTTDYLLGLSDVRKPDTTMQAVCEYTGLSEKVIERLSLFENRKLGLKPISNYLSESINYFLSEENDGENILCSIYLAPKINKEGDKLRDEIIREVKESLENTKDWDKRLKIIVEAQKKIDRVRNEQKLLKYDTRDRFDSLLEKLLKMTDWTEFDDLWNKVMYEGMEEHHAKEK